MNSETYLKNAIEESWGVAFHAYMDYHDTLEHELYGVMFGAVRVAQLLSPNTTATIWEDMRELYSIVPKRAVA